jgi:tetratricopeptide (TPR) repeat protein
MLNLDPRSEYYDYGLYTVGLSLLRMKSIKRAVAVFRKLVTMPIISEERRAVVDEGRLTLGFLYYELGYYREAINYFIKISETHRRYADALLAQGWSFIKFRNFAEAIAPLVELVDKFPDDYKAEEALLLLGRCYLELDLYNEAIAVYEKIILLFPEENVLPDLVNTVNQSLDLEDESIERLREDLLVLESKLIESLPYDDSSALPDYLQEEKEELNNSRETLLETIKRERVNFLQMQANIQELKELLAIKLERKSWRAYAEYGKSRALFLKGTTQKGDK